MHEVPDVRSLTFAPSPLPEVNDRVQVSRDRATIRYIGPVVGQDGTWIGLEWDDAARGKHNGTTGGHQYFTCTSGSNSGSFVRMEKVNFGTSLLEGLVARYTNVRGEEGIEEVSKEELYVHTKTGRVMIEVVGEEKAIKKWAQIHLLKSARVHGAAVSHLGDPAQLATHLPSLTAMDLTCNLFSSWEFVEGLSSSLSKLSDLNLSDNRIALPATALGRPPLTNLTTLRLNYCGLSWQKVAAIEPSLPSLQV